MKETGRHGPSCSDAKSVWPPPPRCAKGTVTPRNSPIPQESFVKKIPTNKITIPRADSNKQATNLERDENRRVGRGAAGPAAKEEDGEAGRDRTPNERRGERGMMRRRDPAHLEAIGRNQGNRPRVSPERKDVRVYVNGRRKWYIYRIGLGRYRTCGLGIRLAADRDPCRRCAYQAPPYHVRHSPHV